MSKRVWLNVGGTVKKVSRKGKRWNSAKGWFEKVPAKPPKYRPRKKAFIETEAAFPGKRRAHAVRTRKPTKQRASGLWTPSGKPLVMVERPTNLDWKDELHNPDVICGIINSTFDSLQEKCQGRTVVGWRGAFVFLISKKDKPNGTPDWQRPPLAAGTHNYAKVGKAKNQICQKLRGVFDTMDTDVSDHRYRVWIQRVIAYATLAGKEHPRGIKLASRDYIRARKLKQRSKATRAKKK